MSVGVRSLRPLLRQGEELVAHVDEGHGFGSAAQRKVEDGAVERQRIGDVADCQRDMVDADSAGLCGTVLRFHAASVVPLRRPRRVGLWSWVGNGKKKAE